MAKKKAPLTKLAGWALIGFGLYRLLNQKPGGQPNNNDTPGGGGTQTPADPGDPPPALVLTQQPVKEKAI